MTQYQVILMPGNSFEITIDGHHGVITIDHPIQGPATAIVSTAIVSTGETLTRLFQFSPLPIEAARQEGQESQ
jgi:hypothetical protein